MARWCGIGHNPLLITILDTFVVHLLWFSEPMLRKCVILIHGQGVVLHLCSHGRIFVTHQTEKIGKVYGTLFWLALCILSHGKWHYRHSSCHFDCLLPLTWLDVPFHFRIGWLLVSRCEGLTGRCGAEEGCSNVTPLLSPHVSQKLGQINSLLHCFVWYLYSSNFNEQDHVSWQGSFLKRNEINFILY